jgi:hypothetical protein
MTVPAFTADASLYTSRSTYGTSVVVDLSASVLMAGASRTATRPTRVDFDEVARLGDYWREPRTLKTQSWQVSNCSLVWDGATTGATVTRCYNAWHYRPASPLSECPGADRSGLLCYPPCRAGYTGVGPVCWQQCPPGYDDDGATCRRNSRIISADNSHCPWYDKCGLGLERGCSTCPTGYHNDGCTCRIDVRIFGKDTYVRGAGYPMSCKPGTQKIGALCYGNCPPGYKAEGIYCNAVQQTCEQVPVQEPSTPLQPFCFELHDPESWVQPCLPVKVYADSEDNAITLAQCQCVNCSVNRVSCAEVDTGRACT